MKKLSECPGNKSKRGNNEDALIIETCKMNNMTFITNDSTAQKVCKDIEVVWLDLEDFLAIMRMA